MKSTPEDFQALSDAVVDALEKPDQEAIRQATDDFARALNTTPPEKTVVDLFEKLRNRTRFLELARLADAVLDSGLSAPSIHRYYAQALIDLGCLAPALAELARLLEQLTDKQVDERSEALGLKGRVHKQRFVRSQGNRKRAAIELRSAINFYRQAYPLNPAWHGSNLVALICRAEREGIAPGQDLKSERMAAQVLADLKKVSPWNAWTHAAAAQCYMALNQWDNANQNYGKFIGADDINAFTLGGEARQLREIWGAVPGGEDQLSSILLALDAQRLCRTGGQLQYTPQEMSQLSGRLQNVEEPADGDHLQALLGENRQITLGTMLSLLKVTPAVCQIVDKDYYRNHRKSGGTGFLLDGGAFDPQWEKRPLLVTNNHVLTEDGQTPSVRRQNALAIFHFWGGKEESRQFPIQPLLWTSPHSQLDVSIAFLEGLDDDTEPTYCVPNDDPAPLANPDAQTKDKVYVIGHPEGRGLEFSLSDNEVLDHDLDAAPDESPGFRRIHYKAPTEKGSSGSPVLDDRSFRVLGLHHSGGRIHPLHGSPVDADYQANEAVWIQSILQRYREPQGP